MSVDPWVPKDASAQEKDLLERKVTKGVEVDPVPKIPDAPDIASGPVRRAGPNDWLEGRTELGRNELPHASRHFVVWGSKLLDDIRSRPVKKVVDVTEDQYAARMRSEAQQLVDQGLKNPVWKEKNRMERAEEYARWRYKGHVAGEVQSL